MKRRSPALLLVVACVASMLLPLSSAAQYGPEEQALVEMVTATEFATMERHLPEAVKKAFREATPEQRKEFQEEIFIAEKLRQEHVRLRVPEDGRALLVVEKLDENGEAVKEVLGDIVVRKRLSGGDEAVLALRLNRDGAEADRREYIHVWMKMEAGEWRLTERQGGSESIKFDDKFLERHRTGRQASSEASAVASMRTLNTAQVTYAATYEHAGFADSLEALGGTGEDMHRAGLTDSVLAAGVKNGYRFTMVAGGGSPRTKYQITGRPLEYGVNGRRSFFTDKSGIIRFTEENREPTGKDPPLQ